MGFNVGVIFMVLFLMRFFMNVIRCFFFVGFFCKLVCSIWVCFNVWYLLFGSDCCGFLNGRGVFYCLFWFFWKDLFINFMNLWLLSDSLVLLLFVWIWNMFFWILNFEMLFFNWNILEYGLKMVLWWLLIMVVLYVVMFGLWNFFK